MERYQEVMVALSESVIKNRLHVSSAAQVQLLPHTLIELAGILVLQSMKSQFVVETRTLQTFKSFLCLRCSETSNLNLAMINVLLPPTLKHASNTIFFTG